ncbi:MAG: hypothetical protein WDO24_30285 [Pseudomonadota bacterium]
MLVAGSDHGHRTISRAINIDDALVGAGLKAAPDSSDVVVAPQGTAALIYLAAAAASRRAAIAPVPARPGLGRRGARGRRPDCRRPRPAGRQRPRAGDRHARL